MINRLFLHIYDYLSGHGRLAALMFALLLAFIVWGVFRLEYKEDIIDFLPLNQQERRQMTLSSDNQDVGRIVVLFESGDGTDVICDAVDDLADALPYDFVAQPGLEQYAELLADYYRDMPFRLTQDDYHRIDSLLAIPGYVDKQLANDKNMLLSPFSTMTACAVRYDPLRLFPAYQPSDSSAVCMVDGYIFNKAQTVAMAYLNSPYGATETNLNTALVDSLNLLADSIMQNHPSVSVRLIGAPVVAVENARCIKRDSAIAIGLSSLLILLVLLYTFRLRRGILLILCTVAFGWFFGMAVVGFVLGSISVIVLGIGAVIIGIAVNYPLHMVQHRSFTDSLRSTIFEVVEPLVIGNITTVSAFIALIPLSSAALRELGLFAAAMLVGTILFTLVFLPLLMKHYVPKRVTPLSLFGSKGFLSAKPLIWFCCIITVVLAFFCRYDAFDSNLSNINYMTDSQRADFALLESFIPSKQPLDGDTQLWLNFCQRRGVMITSELNECSSRLGFNQEAFSPFVAQLSAPLPEHSDDIIELRHNVVERMNSEFGYLGLVCSVVVFVFLCLTFRSIWLGLIAFAPMAVSWIWIFGLMHIFGVHFNIVNIILATFIFGQGDDYTIFMVEGLEYERRSGCSILPEFRHEIFLSALIMLIGIGVLVVARHPAMFSLGVVTLIGMSSVVLLTYTLPPVLYKIYVRYILKQ